jgi:3-oxoacyl-[acyl-carrier protein] reductase
MFVSKVILITGTSRGLGLHLANYFLEKNYIVIGCSRNKHNNLSHYNYTHFSIDIRDEKSILLIFNYIKSKYGKLDFLINNAVSNPKTLNSILISHSSFLDAFETNLFAPMVFSREAVKLMIKNKFGRIVNIGSIVSKHLIGGNVLYNTTKSSLNTFSIMLANEVFNFGITVNIIAPSVMKTDLYENANHSTLKLLLERCIVKDFGSFADITRLLDFLFDEENSTFTGQTFYLGGA